MQKLELDGVQPLKAFFTSDKIELIVGFNWTVQNNPASKTYGPLFSIAVPQGKPFHTKQTRQDSPKAMTVLMQRFLFVESDDEVNLHQSVEIGGVRACMKALHSAHSRLLGHGMCTHLFKECLLCSRNVCFVHGMLVCSRNVCFVHGMFGLFTECSVCSDIFASSNIFEHIGSYACAADVSLLQLLRRGAELDRPVDQPKILCLDASPAAQIHLWSAFFRR